MEAGRPQGFAQQPQPERAGQGRPVISLQPPEVAQDSLQQDTDRSLVILVIGHPRRDAKSFWSGTLKLKQKGHIFRVDDINRLHAAQLLPGGTEERSYGGFQGSQGDPGQSGWGS